MSSPSVPRTLRPKGSREGMRWLPAGVVLLVAIVVAVPAAALSGATEPLLLADTGPVVRWGQVLVAVVHDLAAAATVGLLVVGAFLTPEARRTHRRERAAHAAGWTAALWAVSALALMVLGFAEISGLPLGSPGLRSELLTTLVQVVTGSESAIELVRLWLIEVVLAVGLTAVAFSVRTRGGLAWACALALATLVPIAYTGHASSTEGHDTAITALGLHLVGITVWLGGLLAIIMLRPALGPALEVTVRRYSTLALWAFVTVAGSGVLFALLSVDDLGDLRTAYWLLIWGKIAALVALGGFGYVHRRRSLAGGLQRSGAFARLATVELAVMGLAVGLGVTLSRTPPPQVGGADAGDPVSILTGYPAPPALSAGAMVTQWELNWLWLIVAGLAVGLYVAAVLRLRARGDHWPVARTLVWVLGWAVLVYTTSGAPGVYGRVMFSMHMVMHMSLMMAVPILLVPGSAITLALRALPSRADKTLGPREVLLALAHSRYAAVIANPVVAAVLLFASLVGFYWSGALELALRTHTGHLLMTVHFLLVGYAFVWALIGTDPGPPKWSPPLRLLVLMATLAAHAFFGLALMMGTWLLAPGFFKGLELGWVPSLIEDQQLGGMIAWGIGEVPTLLLAMLVTLDWSRRDDREARRTDRRAERDDDAELSAYNARLATLTGQRRAERASGAR